ncbi:MAG TPA: hypothetical protein VL137_06970 [Polyangiaceae bacterium]|nr:hypothetical protein [Polyangiaceae bacterium]
MFITVLVGAAVSGHIGEVKIQSLVLLLLLPLTVAGCGSATSASNAAASGGSGNYTGGQTGSLIPNCGLAPGSERGSSVPSEEQAFVLYTDGCPAALQPGGITVTDANGKPIQIALHALGDGTYLVSSQAVLEQGRYVVTLPQGADQASATIEVSQPAPLPTRIGQLSVTSSCSSNRLLITLDSALTPYLPLTGFSYSVDGGPPIIASAYGALVANSSDAATADATQLSIALPRCDKGGFCLPPGSHTVAVMATIAGETVQPDPLSGSVRFDCMTQTQSDGTVACNFTASVQPHTPWLWAWMIALSTALFALRARRGIQP